MSSRLKLAGICFAAAFVLAACGGGGSPLDAVRAERDQLAEQLRQAEQARDEARSQVTTLTADLNTANQSLMDKQSELDTANQNLMDKQSELDTANQDLMDKQAEVDRLIGNQDIAAIRAKDPADRTQAEQQLLDAVDARDIAQSDVTRLTGERDDANDDVTRLQGELDDANDEVDRLEGELRTANAINMLFAAAQSTRGDADAAVMAAGDAVKNAVKYAGMLDVASVKGNSAMAAANAQKVLDAQTAGNQAGMDAEAAQEAAEGALADAMALADSATKTGLVAALEAAVEHAKAQVTAAKMARDINPVVDPNVDPVVATEAVDSLAEAVARVTGGENADPQGTPKSIGDGVAMQVGMALLPTADLGEATPDGTMVRVNHYGTATDLTAASPPADTDDRTFHMNNSDGMTWEMIVGGAVATKTISTGTGIDALTEVKATPVSSMTVNFATAPTLPAVGTNAVFGSELDQGATYMGIPGFVFCGGADCAQNAAGDLTGSWYFRPTSTTAVFVMNADGTAYMGDTTFSQWGHWLVAADHDSDAATPDQVTIHTYAITGANTANLNVGVATGCDPECTASYSGSAAGMSLHKTFDGNGNQLTINSGAFTADVTLTARFGTAPMLSGRVNNFQGGPQVDTGWMVELQDTAIGATTAAVTGGVAKGSGQAADWAAQGYGPAQTPAEGANPAVNHRPDGFIGNFEAHFTDGHATGAFVTE